MVTTILKNVTEEQEEELIRQYEIVRSSGDCNMFDSNCVMASASRHDCYELVTYMDDHGRKGYVKLLSNYAELMKKHDVKRGGEVEDEATG